MKFFRTLLIFALPATVCAWLCYTFWYAYQPKPEQLQGQIEAQQYRISSKVAGRLDQVLVRKGDQVNSGDLIFTILSPEIDARLVQAQAGQDAAEAVADDIAIGTRTQQIEAARDTWQQAQAATELLDKTYRRIDNLYRDGVVSEQKRDEAYTKLVAARYSSNAALQMYQLAQEGARDETKKAAAGKARMAAGAVAEVEVYAADTRVESPHDGEVTQILLRSGELAPQGFPVVSIMDMTDAWAVFHIREDRLREFAKDSKFEAFIPALGDEPYTFSVSHVAVMGDFATWRATSNDAGFDMRSFEIEARPVEHIDGLRAGMSVLIRK